MKRRARQKANSHKKIVKAAARRFRDRGLGGAGVDAIMHEAGLTHGGFYAHFQGKTALIAEAVVLAQEEIRSRWFAGLDKVAPGAKAASIASRYLNASHRDDAATGCPLPALSAEIARQGDTVREAFGGALEKTIGELAASMPGPGEARAREQAMGTLAACVGGILLARAVPAGDLSDAILRGSRGFVLRGISRSRKN